MRDRLIALDLQNILAKRIFRRWTIFIQRGVGLSMLPNVNYLLVFLFWLRSIRLY